MSRSRDRLERRYLAMKIIAIVLTFPVLMAMGAAFLVGGKARRAQGVNGSAPLEMSVAQYITAPPPAGTYIRLTGIEWGADYYLQSKSVVRQHQFEYVCMAAFPESADDGAAAIPAQAILISLHRASSESAIEAIAGRSEFVGYVVERPYPNSFETEAHAYLKSKYPNTKIDGNLVVADDTPVGLAGLAVISWMGLGGGGFVLVLLFGVFVYAVAGSRRLRHTPPPLPRR